MSKSSPWMGFLVTIFAAIAMLIDLIIFSIALDSLDTAYTAAATYTEQVGLTSVMGIWPLVLFVIFMAAGLAALAGGAIIQARRAITGGWMDVFLTAVMGGVALIICRAVEHYNPGSIAYLLCSSGLYDFDSQYRQLCRTAQYYDRLWYGHIPEPDGFWHRPDSGRGLWRLSTFSRQDIVPERE